MPPALVAAVFALVALAAAAAIRAEERAGGGATASVAAAPRAVVAAERADALAVALGTLVEQSHRVVRAYAQQGLEIRPASAAAALSEAARIGERQVAALAAQPSRRLGATRQRELAVRWRALREATATRPARGIAELMDDVASQLAARATAAGVALPPPPRALRQRILLHRMAGAYLLACWGATSPSTGRMLAMRAEFGHLLGEMAEIAPDVDGLDAATLRNQWGLLADGLDGHGAPCDAAAMTRVASTADRLAQLLDLPPLRVSAARQP